MAPKKTATRKAPARKTVVRLKAPVKTARCVICGEQVAQFSTEELCWVCRRLKISAWRDVEGQAAIQE
ncbi:MAG: hypothetical protein HY858_02080 [Candidatus Solibacter usitatus]|nr:hypothetical protein [Candidatus Solibacter usitatus]